MHQYGFAISEKTIKANFNSYVERGEEEGVTTPYTYNPLDILP